MMDVDGCSAPDRAVHIEAQLLLNGLYNSEENFNLYIKQLDMISSL